MMILILLNCVAFYLYTYIHITFVCIPPPEKGMGELGDMGLMGVMGSMGIMQSMDIIGIPICIPRAQTD